MGDDTMHAGWPSIASRSRRPGNPRGRVKPSIVEVVQGLGRGGAERALASRLSYAPADLDIRLLNLRPDLVGVRLPVGYPQTNIHGPFPQQVMALRRYISHLQPDLVITRAPAGAIVVATAMRALAYPPKLIHEAHLDVLSPSHWREALLRPTYSISARQITLGLAVSHAVAQGAQCQPLRNVVVHYLGADVNVDARRVLPSIDGTRFLLLGRLAPQKRPLDVVGAVGELRELFRQTQSRLTIVGAGPLSEDVMRSINDLDILDIVEVVGEVDDPSGVLASSDVLTTFGRNEGLPLTIFEAKQMGLQVIATPAGGSQEVLDRWDVRLRDFSLASLVEAIRRLAVRRTNAAQREEIVAAGKKWQAGIAAHSYFQLIRGMVSE